MDPISESILPAGDYLIIDPGYVLSTQGRREALFRQECYEVWARGVCILTDPVTGCRFAYSSTRYGDGAYPDNQGYGYGVDSGSLACLPLAMVDAAVLATLPTRDRSVGQICSGRLVTFSTPAVCAPCDADGIIRFGHIEIDTSRLWQPEDEEEDEDW
jgi:hypothetical protein